MFDVRWVKRNRSPPVRSLCRVLTALLSGFWVCGVKKERKRHATKEGWEDGTPPPHRDFKGRKESVFLAVAHPWASA